MQNNNKTNGLAIAGFVTSFFVSIVGLILSIVGLCQIKKTDEKGKGFAIAGIVISAIKLAFVILLVAFSILVWPTIRNSISESVSNSVECSKAFDCEENDNGNYTCYYCEDATEDCYFPKEITCAMYEEY